MNTSLPDFIAHARKKGMDHQTIRMLLLASGWKERDIVKALTEQTLEMDVPVPPDTGGAREAFFHLLTFVGLYTWVISLIILFFNYINRAFPDAAFPDYDYYGTDWQLSTIRWSLAAVIVSFPLLYLLSRFLIREMKQTPEKAWSGVRRWLTYLTLFVAAAALMGDVITLVFYLLEGEISIRFLLKVFVVLVIAGTTFMYYFLSLKIHPSDPRGVATNRMFGWIAIALTLIALIWGIWIVGTPGASRDQRFDEERITDLQIIQNELSAITLGDTLYLPPNEQVMKNPLPATLAEASKKVVQQKIDIMDPETGEPYEYRVTGDSTYELCATFNYARDDRFNISWNHPAGNHCYSLDVLNPTIMR